MTRSPTTLRSGRYGGLSSPLGIAAAAVLAAVGSIVFSADTGPSAGEKPEPPAVEKPVDDHPKTFEELSRDPKFKDARLVIPADTILGKDPAHPLPRWVEHKHAMHLKALKRSDNDRDDLRSLVDRLRRRPQDGSGSVSGADDAESSFQRLDDHLTIFRFTNFSSFIKAGAEKKAVALGKAFFWDVHFSSDQQVACATCHYAAGADRRTRATVTLPVNFGIHAPWPNPRVEPAPRSLNPYNLSSADLTGDSDELDFGSPTGVFDPPSLAGFATREVIGSIGIVHRRFGALSKTVIDDRTQWTESRDDKRYQTSTEGVDPALHRVVERVDEIEGTYRQVTQRNAGTVVNAVFNSRNFHDSRADSVFNGRTGWGMHDDPQVNDALFVLRNENGRLVRTYTFLPERPQEANVVADAGPANPASPPNEPNPAGNPSKRALNPYFIANASLASQAVEPPVSDVEMSYRGRMFHHIARRMLDEPILNRQTIAPDDSSLAAYAKNRPTYRQLIQEVFVDTWWNHPGKITLPSTGLSDDNDENLGLAQADYEQMEANFSLFWGLALHVYQSTLIADDSPFDRELRAQASSQRARKTEQGKWSGHLSESASRGLTTFRNLGCSECHSGPEFTAASFFEIGLLGADGKPRFPDVIDEEDDIVEGFEFCPDDSPTGVECMSLGGRFDSLYDGGNYVLGVSRFERRSTYPKSPPVRGGQLVEHFLFPRRTAHWEDSGNGLEFIPPEEQPADDAPYESISELQRARFGRHLVENEVERNRLAALLGMTLEAPKVNTTPANPPAVRLGRGNPLNSTQIQRGRTQQRRELPKEAPSQKGRAPANATPSEAAVLLSNSADRVTINPLGFIEVRFPGSNPKEYLVTHQTPVPLRSISREYLPRWEAYLRERNLSPSFSVAERIADAGAFKVPTLRNIELTGPYMHNGSLLTLDAVVEFYVRGGDFNDRVIADQDDIRTGHQHPDMIPLALSVEQKRDLVEFMKALTDRRVAISAAPFDHPELPLVVGPAVGAGPRRTAEAPDGASQDGAPQHGARQPSDPVEYEKRTVPAVGAAGGEPIESFESLLRNTPGMATRRN